MSNGSLRNIISRGESWSSWSTETIFIRLGSEVRLRMWILLRVFGPSPRGRERERADRNPEGRVI